MLNVRHFFRLCKQSAQCTLARPSIYFSSSADDSNSKRPPNKGDSETLDALLNATYSSKTSSAQKPKQSPAPSTPKKTLSSKLGEDDSQSTMPSKKIQGDLEETLPSKAETPKRPSIDLKIQKKQHPASAKDLMERLRKIAKEVADPAGPKSNEIADDLIKKLQSAVQATDKPLDMRELTFKGDFKDDTNQGLDMLRNKIVTEEQVYKISPVQEELKRRGRSGTDMPSSSFPQGPQINVLRDLDVSLHPKIRMGIFEPESKENQVTKSCLRTMEKLEQKELNLSKKYSPRNWFEQCIEWTEQGKLWHFPINNEQGLEDQAAVPFTEHVFLEDHLEGWCPTFGPVRHFMELVCLGLSKNPYLSVEEKIDYIVWYRDYLAKHRDILEAAGTLGTGVTKVPALEAQ